MVDGAGAREGSGRSGRVRRVTMTDVARQAEVSVAAVSYALSGSPGVSDEMRDRITRIADELGFRPNRLAQELRAGAANTIGLLLADIANPFYPEVASGVIAAAAAKDFEVFVSHVGVDGERQVEATMTQVDRHSSGLLFTSLVATDAPLLSELRARSTPFVQLHRRVEGVDADWVGIDNLAAGREVGQHIAQCGHRRVAVLGGPESSSVSRDRANGFMAALADAGVEVLNAGDVWGMLTREDGAARARQLFAAYPSVDAVLCGNDMIAMGVLDVCREQSRSVPGDVALTGFDDMSFASAGPLQLTTVTVPRELMGSRGAEILLSRIAGDQGPAQQEVLPHTLQVRATTGQD